MKVLLIDNHRDPACVGASPLRRAILSAATQRGIFLELHTRRGPEADFAGALRLADALVLSGSATSCLSSEPWITEQLKLIEEFLGSGRAVLGVCFGHQLLARAVWGAEVCRRSAQPEKDWVVIRKTPQASGDPLLADLPNHFMSYASHSEEVALDTQQAQPLLTSEACGNHAFRVTGKSAWGIQFHPEKTPRDLIDEGLGLKNFPSRTGRKLQVYDPTVAQQLFSNFLGLVRS